MPVGHIYRKHICNQQVHLYHTLTSNKQLSFKINDNDKYCILSWGLQIMNIEL